MSDNRRRYRTIRNVIQQLYPTEPKGNVARHLNTLAALVSGIVGSKSTHLPAIAGKVPDGTKKESRIKKFSRWIKNERIHAEIYFLPYADALLESLADHRTLLLAMDGSQVGRQCLALMVSVIYKKRALPISSLFSRPESQPALPVSLRASRSLVAVCHTPLVASLFVHCTTEPCTTSSVSGTKPAASTVTT